MRSAVGRPLAPRRDRGGIAIVYLAVTSLPDAASTFVTYLGYRLFILGVTGEASLVVNAQTLQGQLINAAPGLFFSVGGIIAPITAIWKGSGLTFTDTGNSGSEYAVRT